jgi:hypothetical protein
MLFKPVRFMRAGNADFECCGALSVCLRLYFAATEVR